ncbi:MAG: hypothetical protein QM800_15945 [Paludibacter sp.]
MAGLEEHSPEIILSSDDRSSNEIIGNISAELGISSEKKLSKGFLIIKMVFKLPNWHKSYLYIYCTFPNKTYIIINMTFTINPAKCIIFISIAMPKKKINFHDSLLMFRKDNAA